ncbi:MAG: N-acetyltransferase [Acidobacteria bacterium]|nr:MAG: N-acetyltransferase [Acidobacteriota bacterium]REK00335.1 MAG: N-acetyltransferase [Acidobacteriota bacterium]
MTDTAKTWTHGSERYRYATLDDLGSFATMLADPEVGRWLWFTPIDAEGVAQFFTPFLAAQQGQIAEGITPQTAVFTVEDSGGGYLGLGAVVEVDGSPGGFELGFQLSRAAWGRGVGTRLSRFLAAYALTLCDAFRLEASCLEGNTASRRLLENLGLELEGRRPGFRLKQGERHTELLYGAEVSRLDRERLEATARDVGLI